MPKDSTLAVHAGEERREAHDAVTTPIVCSATYAFADTAEIVRYFEGDLEREEYGRYGNPTVRAAEKKIAALEGAEDCALFATGMAAVTTTLFELLKSGDHVILTSDCYRRTRQFVRTFLSRFGVSHTLVDPGDAAALEDAVRPGKTRLIVSESPTNPYLRVADLRALAKVRPLNSYSDLELERIAVAMIERFDACAVECAHIADRNRSRAVDPGHFSTTLTIPSTATAGTMPLTVRGFDRTGAPAEVTVMLTVTDPASGSGSLAFTGVATTLGQLCSPSRGPTSTQSTDGRVIGR